MNAFIAAIAWTAFFAFVALPAFVGYCLIWAIVDGELRHRKESKP